MKQGYRDLRLDEIIWAARTITPEDLDRAQELLISSSNDLVRLAHELTDGREPLPAFLVGVLIGLKLGEDSSMFTEPTGLESAD